MRRLPWLFLALVLLGLIWRGEYPDWIAWLTELSGQAELKVILQERLLPPSRFEYLRGGLTALALLFTWALQRLWTGRKAHQALIGEGLKQIKTLYSRYWPRPKPWVWAVSALVLIRAAYWLYALPLQYDECWTYRHFSAQSPLFNLLAPHNNHPFYSFLASFSRHLPLPAALALRLPAFLGGVLALWAFWGLAHRLLGARRGPWAWLVFALSAPLNIYLVFARGYSWMLFWGIIWLFLSLIISRLAWSKARSLLPFYALSLYLAWFSNLGALAAWPGTALWAWAAWRRGELGAFLRLHLGLGLGLLLILSPQLFGGLFQAAKASAQTDTAWYWRHTCTWFWTGEKWPLQYLALTLWLLPVLVWRIGGLRRYAAALRFGARCTLGPAPRAGLAFGHPSASLGRPPLPVCLIILGLGLPPLLTWGLSLYAPERFWTFLSLYFALSWAWLWPRNLAKVLPLLALVLGYLSFNHGFMFWSKAYDAEIKTLAQDYLRPSDSLYCYPNYYKPGLEFWQLWLRGEKLKVFMPHPDSRDYAPLQRIPLPNLILEAPPLPAQDSALVLGHYQPVYRSEEIVLWRRKIN